MSDEYVAPRARARDLQPRQLAVASLVARAKTDQQIAAELKIGERRVRQHIEALAYLLHIDRGRNVRVQIAMWWRDQVPELTTIEEHATT